MKIIVAKTAGFCFGVNKAVEFVYSLLEKTGGKVYTLGPIIHNEHLVNDLVSKGVTVINEVCEIDRDEEPSRKKHIVIRTHGVTPEVYNNIQVHNIEISDATCPYVKKIHNLVKEKHEEGYSIIIIGDKAHPEVIGINGWCDNTADVVNTVEEVHNLVGGDKKACVVSQTTMTRDKWELLCSHLEKKFKNLVKFNTICNATSSRQEEACSIAKSVNVMIVIGSNKSSNTQKLYEICKNHCPETYNVETADDLPSFDAKKIESIGITAGASTPEWIIKEVVAKMEELNKQEQEVSFKDAFEDSLVTLQSGSIVKGKIIGFNNAEVFVDLGYKSDGVIAMDQFSEDPDFNPEESIKIGDEVEAFIIRVNDGEGNVLLSKKKVDAMKNWSTIEEAYKEKLPVKAKVIEETNGGLIANANGIRVFIPASQVGERFLKDFKDYLKRTINIRIIEFNKNKRKVVGSERVLLVEERKRLEDELWGNIEVGKTYKGIVRSLTDFGAFVDIGGVDGLIHISEMSWSKIKHPSEVMKVNDEVEVTVLDFDREKSRISLGYRKDEDNPWNKVEEKYKTGEVVKGKVVRLVPFGAFIELEKGVDGLVHISQISTVRIAKPGDVLKIGQEVEVKVIEVNGSTQKISLSIKEVNPIDPPDMPVKEEVKEKAVKRVREEVLTEHTEDMSVTIGDMLSDLKAAEINELKDEIAVPQEENTSICKESSEEVPVEED